MLAKLVSLPNRQNRRPGRAVHLSASNQYAQPDVVRGLENWYKGSSPSINTDMNITTVSLDKSTRDALASLKEQESHPHYDATVSWLIEEVNSND